MAAKSSGLKLKGDPGSLILPGEKLATILNIPEASQAVIRVGGGVTQKSSDLLASKAGHIRYEPNRNKLWVANNQKRYVPALEDPVIGIIQDRFGEEYRLDINGSDTATLSMLAFEGATKKNRPNLTIGALVYCRVIRASKNMETEVSCIEPGSTKSWSGGETLYGELQSGTIVQVSLGMAKNLVRDETVLRMLGRVPFQSAVGVNGRIWVQAGKIEHTMLLSLALKKADVMQADEWRNFVRKLFS
ncbi:Exosome complex RNA-binding protein 1/RRP40/RRP4 [Gracilaria domingensis]|nr:Exosome complex RNA-binding protein 1/RRP40/RRP4 [Gracilaria domingensis]